MTSLVFAFKVMFFYQIRPQNVSKVMISLASVFKVTVFIILGHKLSVK